MLIDVNEMLQTLKDRAANLAKASNDASLGDAEREEFRKAREKERAAVDAAIKDVTTEVDRVNKYLDQRDNKWPGLVAQYATEFVNVGKALNAAPFKDLDALRTAVAAMPANKVNNPADLDSLLVSVIKKFDDETAKMNVAPDYAHKVRDARKALEEKKQALDAANKDFAVHESEVERIRVRTNALLTNATNAIKEVERAVDQNDGPIAIRGYLEARAAWAELTDLLANKDEVNAVRDAKRDAVAAALGAWVHALDSYIDRRNKATETHA